ncbi:MAG: sigma-70 family RNA polymerase sigma factor [Ignavibacteriaceae bacterium]
MNLASKEVNIRKNKEILEYSKVPDTDDDFSLIKRFNEGDESIFPGLVRKHKEKVRNIIYLTLGNINSVDDLAQEVFIAVYKNLSHFRFECRFTTWLYRITVNKCKDHRRKMKIRNVFIPLKETEEDLKYSPDIDSGEIQDIVKKAISKLPEKLRIPLLLKDIEGFSYQEIAEFVECEIGTVKSRIFRARESLRELLKPFEKELMV